MKKNISVLIAFLQKSFKLFHFILKSHFNFQDMGLSREFLYTTMFKFGNSLWVFFCTCIVTVYGFLLKQKNRFFSTCDSPKGYSIIHIEEDDLKVVARQSDLFEEKDEDYFNAEDEETECSAFTRNDGLSLSTRRYQFVAGKVISGFITGEPLSFTIHELFKNPTEDPINHDQALDIHKVESEDEEQKPSSTSNNSLSKFDQVLADEVTVLNEFNKFNSEEEDIPKKSEDLIENFISEYDFEQIEEENIVDDHADSKNDQEMDTSENQIVPLFSFNSDMVFDYVDDESPISNYKLDLDSYRFLSEEDFIEGLQENDLLSEDERIEFEEKAKQEEIGEKDLNFVDDELALQIQRCDVSETTDECIELEPNITRNNESEQKDIHLNDFSQVEDSQESENKRKSEAEQFDNSMEFREAMMEKKFWDSDTESDDEEDDILWEHRELIEQMKMERKASRVGNLPTILEECESQKMTEDMRPLEISEQIEHKDQMEEIQKFYKSYAEKMRKLDILNYQTMHAISFLQLKNPIQLTSIQRSSISAIKSILLPSLWPCKLRRIYADPTFKSITEMYRNLEAVYVGQICLSWEVLRWQYEKIKLQQQDSNINEGLYSYNGVAGEFQQFQVLMQRFIEDEPFQEPRIQNYTKKRLVLRGFLHVPVIRDDSYMKGRNVSKEENAVSIKMLINTLEETMQIFWEFLRADKNDNSLIMRSPRKIQFDLHEPSNAALVTEIRTSLQKKEKKLKDILRTGNCIVKKFQKHEGGPLDYETFVSRVELRLISRVLTLSRLTNDQLFWCLKKLTNINQVNRKFHVQSSFLLFPL